MTQTWWQGLSWALVAWSGLWVKSGLAQNLVIDGTLGVPGTSGALLGPIYDVPQGLGSRQGQNLFHSFSQFSLQVGEEARFEAGPEIRNILTRVTGGSASQIDGVISTPSSTANFFLMNPAGLVFGPNAQLDLGGSFVGTTASRVRFGEFGEFSVVNPQAPALLTIDPSALLFGVAPGQIVSRSVAPAGVSPSGRSLFGLTVSPGQSLALVGGDITVDGGGVIGGLNAQGGWLELGGLANAGSVDLASLGTSGWRLVFPGDAALANVRLVNGARVNVRGVGGGDIRVNANRLLGEDGGRLIAGTEGNGDAGDLIVNAKTIEFRGQVVNANQEVIAASGASNDVADNATANSGLTQLKGDRLILSAGAQVGNATFGDGDSGPVVLEFQDAIILDGLDKKDTGIFSQVFNTNTLVNSGDLRIKTPRLQVTNGAQISSAIFGTGNGGLIRIDADEIILTGRVSCGNDCNFASSIASGTDNGAEGNGGDIEIFTDSLTISDGADINSFLRGRGKGGDITIEGREFVELDGSPSTINTSIFPDGVGNGGNITLSTPTLSLHRGAFIESGNSGGKGDAGDISITSDRLEISQLGEDSKFSGAISSQSNGKGDSGAITIDASQIIFQDEGGMFAGVFIFDEFNVVAEGSGQDIQIKAQSLYLNNFLITTQVSGNGTAGNIRIQAEGPVSLESSSISTAFGGVESIGQAGNVQINAQSLNLKDSSIISITRAKGDSGSITLQTREDIRLDGKTLLGSSVTDERSSGRAQDISLEARAIWIGEGVILLSANVAQNDAGAIRLKARDRIDIGQEASLFSSTFGAGKAGDILIDTPVLTMAVGSQLRSESLQINSEDGGVGTAGNIEIAGDRLTVNGATISTNSANTDGGNIRFNLSDAVLFSNNSLLSTNAGTAQGGGNGGNITINTPFLIGLPNNNSDIIANAFSGSGGKIQITTQGILNFDLANNQTDTQLRANTTNDISASSQLGTSGILTLTGFNTDPSQGTVALSETFTDPTDQIDRSCSPEGIILSEFFITGRSGLPLSPDESFSTDLLAGWVPLAEQGPNLAVAEQSRRPRATMVLEASAWERDRQGQIHLTAPKPVERRSPTC